MTKQRDNTMTPAQARIDAAIREFPAIFHLRGVEGVFHLSPLGSNAEACAEPHLMLQRRGDCGWENVGLLTVSELRELLVPATPRRV